VELATLTHHVGSVRGCYVHSILRPEAGNECAVRLRRAVEQSRKFLGLVTGWAIRSERPGTESSSTLGDCTMK